MKDYKRIFNILAVCIVGLLIFSSCTIDELPPKTDDVSSNFVLPKGDIPSEVELKAFRAIREEYNNAVNN